MGAGIRWTGAILSRIRLTGNIEVIRVKPAYQEGRDHWFLGVTPFQMPYSEMKCDRV